MIKISFYHNHKEDIGHIMRTLRIIAAMKRLCPSAKIFVFQAGRPQPPFDTTPGIKWMRLPRPFYSRENCYASPTISPDIVRSRSRVLAAALDRIAPDAFVTNFFPFGRRECRLELSSVLQSLRDRETDIFACVPLPYFTHESGQLDELLYFSGLYRKILIHTPAEALTSMARWIRIERRVDPKEFVDVFAKLKDRLQFVGYDGPADPPPPSPAPHPPAGSTILVQRGGGWTSPDIIIKSLLAKRLLDPRYSMLVVAGPATTSSEMRVFRGLIRTNNIRGVTLLKFLPSLSEHVGRSALCVGTAGDVAYESLYHGRRCVMIPFTGGEGSQRADQVCRADELRKLLGATVLEYHTLTPERLARSIEEQLAARPEPERFGMTRPHWFGGCARSASVILSHAQARR